MGKRPARSDESPRDIDRERQATAYHEAGHAVVAYRFNHEASRLTIKRDPDRGIAGFAQTEAAWADGSMNREVILVLFAGYEAEHIQDPAASREGSGIDEEQAKELLRSQSAGAEDEIRSETRKLLRENWRHVEAVATALMEYETLEYDEWAIIIDAIDEETDWRSVLSSFKAWRG